MVSPKIKRKMQETNVGELADLVIIFAEKWRQWFWLQHIAVRAFRRQVLRIVKKLQFFTLFGKLDENQFLTKKKIPFLQKGQHFRERCILLKCLTVSERTCSNNTSGQSSQSQKDKWIINGKVKNLCGCNVTNWHYTVFLFIFTTLLYSARLQIN